MMEYLLGLSSSSSRALLSTEATPLELYRMEGRKLPDWLGGAEIYKTVSFEKLLFKMFYVPVMMSSSISTS